MGCLRFSKEVTSTARLDGKTVVITGCNTGIGKVTCQDLYLRGGRIIMACRDTKKAEKSAQDIRQATEDADGVGKLVVVPLDLSSFASVRKCAAQLLKTETAGIHILINNAGVMACPKGKTEDGFETQFGVNHLGHFLFTLLLLPRILKSAPARIITLASSAHLGGNINFDDLNWEKSYSETFAYAQSKLANILFSMELAKRLQIHGRDNVTTYSLHPGAVDTELQRHADTAYCCCFQWIYRYCCGAVVKTPEQGSRTTIYCAIDEDLTKESGFYYEDCTKTTPSVKARDTIVAHRLWDESVTMVGLTGYNPFTAEDKQPSALPIIVQPMVQPTVPPKNIWLE